MSSFALFRLPYEQQYTLIEQTSGEPLELVSCGELSGKTGFVVSPFAPSSDCPILLIRPDRVTHDFPSTMEVPLRDTASSLSTDSYRDYQVDFANFHAHLDNGDFAKLVLSRSIFIPSDTQTHPLELFRRACDRYPRMMIILVYTPQSGMWLAATPEILLSGGGEQWQTVALAGTMPFEEDVRWSDKNIQEQRYVATYMIEQLEQFTTDFKETGPRTIRAGHLAHLRSDFHFSLHDNKVIGDLLQALHPTPAVCGLPKQEAFRFILHNEHHDRRYYSGFMGPLFVEDKTNLFVTLRCMQLFANGYRLYAGGGILKDSQEEQEWQETEIKLDTMRNIVNNV
ncbi:MAG: isochorismate synthase [Prevotella sp.]|nr:isochorismate synthase [Prevotella sp.]